MRKQIPLLLIYLMFGVICILGQIRTDGPISSTSTESDRVAQEQRRQQEARRRYEIDQMREQQNLKSGRDKDGMMIKSNDVIPVITPKSDVEMETVKSRRESVKMLQPSAKYYEKYKRFLSEENTGIARVFPDIDCKPTNSSKTISVNDADRCAGVPKEILGNGSFYSFIFGKNYLNYNDKKSKNLNPQGWWDIHYIDQSFVSGNCCTQSMIANLGNISIENLSINSPALAYIVNFNAKETVEEVQQQNQILHKGIQANGYVYQKIVPVKNSVYTIRSIAYGVEGNKGKNKKLKIVSDNIAVFDVVEIGNDRSLVIIWKNLSTKK